jgi:peptidoglycan/LPS O-acetylase OafA/YrhL
MRLYPPFLFSLLIAWALLCGEAALRPDLRLGIVGALNLKTFLSNTFLCSDFSGTGWINPVYWSLAIEFQFYLLMAVGFSRFQNAGPRLQVAMVLVATMAAIPFDGHGLILTYLPLFAAGIAIWLFLSGRMGAVGTGLVIAGQSLVVYFHFGLPVALTLVGSVVFCLALKGRRFGRLLFLGNISYSLYLLHVPVGSRLVNAGLRLFHGGLLSYGLLAASVIACLLMSWIFYVLVERPCLHFSRALGKTKPDTTGISWHGLTRESFKRHSFILSRVLTKTQIYK